MLYFVIAWTVLTGVCSIVGTSFLNILNADCFERKGDRFIVAVWLGVVVLAISLLTTSLIWPLSSLVGLGLAVILVSLSLLSNRTRTEVVALWSSLSLGLILVFLALEVLVAALTTQNIIWFDTGLYHFGSIKWLSEYGAVPGVALINSKFGFTSSWFALAAPLTPKVFGDRVGAITNGFIFLIASLQFLITLVQVLKSKAQLPDYFLLVFSLLTVVTYTVTTFTGSPILISFSPDVAVTLITGATAWTMLIISNNSHPIPEAKVSSLDAQTIPLILSTVAVSIKLSALPLLPVGFIFYIFKNKISQRVFLGSAIVILLLSPVIIFGIITSGCPLYPSTFMCLDLPWTVTAQRAISEVKDIKFWHKLVEPEQVDTNPLISAVWNWFKGSTEFQIMFLMIVLSIIFIIKILNKSNNKSKQGLFGVIALGLVGMTFITIQSPLIRFGLGYFILIPCLFIGLYCQKNLENIQRRSKQPPLLSKFRGLSNAVLLNPLFLVGLATVVLVVCEVQSHWLLPSQLPSAKVVHEKVNDLKYVYPANWTTKCWAAKLPCAEVPISKNIKLRAPARGIGAGFVHVR